MNKVQENIAQLQQKGWTLAAIADEIDVTVNAVEKWKAGDRNPRNSKPVVLLLESLLKRKHVPKRKRYKNKIEKTRGENETGQSKT
jgi:transcriptional regulator with XRE-family HTH domain